MKTCYKILTGLALSLVLSISHMAHAQSTDFNPVDDSYVNSSQSGTNYGAGTSVVTKISTNSRYAFFKFDLSSLSDSVTSATLKLNVKSISANSTRSVYAVSDDSWTETALTWDNQPAIGSELTNISIVTSDDEKYVEWDITSYVEAEVSEDGIVTICVNDPGSTDTGIDFYTKENGTGIPVLSVESTSSTPPPLSSEGGFVHPGGLFKQSDLDRMRYMVEAGVEPYATSFSALQADPKASYNHTVQGDPAWTEVNRGGLHGSEFESDANAAYLNALMWAITGDSRHADKCVEIFNTWKNLTDVEGTGGTYALNAGLFAWKLVEAAEIIKSTYSGWLAADIQDFQDMLVYPGYSDTGVPSSVSDTNGTFYWRIYNGDPGRHGNQDMIAWRAMITMGVFLDNEKMYDRALRYFTGQPHRADDIPYHSGPSPSGGQLDDNQYFTAYQYLGSDGTTADYGYNGVLEHYIWENGQNQESSRDQQHAFFGMGIASGIADVAWNQGDTVWNILDNRMLAGFEFMSRYNTSFIASFPDQTSPWEPTSGNGEFIQRKDRTGRWYSKEINPYFESNFTTLSRGDFPGKRPVFEQGWAHFDVRMGLGDSAVWTKRGMDVSIDIAGYEKTGFSLDHAGWGALCFRRPVWAAGDPVAGFTDGTPDFQAHALPLTVEAENYDYFPGNGEGRIYHDLSAGNSGGAYRNDGVDIQSATEGGYAITNLDAGEWLTYTCNVSQAGTYQIDVRYAASNSTGTIRFGADGSDITGDVSLPATGGMTTWATHTVSNSVVLGSGVHVLRTYIGGTDDSFNLNSFTVTLLQGNTAPAVSITSPSDGASFAEGSSVTIVADATDSDGSVANVEFYLGSDKIGEDSQAPYELTWNYLPVGTHDLTAKAIDNDGATGTSSVVSITVTTGSGTSQGTDLNSTDDSFVHSTNTTTNYGSNTSVVTKWSSADSRYAFFKFDLSSIQGAVSSATLKLKVKSISANSTRSAYKVNDDSWSESTITYANQPTIGNEMSNISITTSQNGTYVEWDVTDYVAVENGLDGLVTLCINDVMATDTGIDFYTKESAGNEPVLSVTYTVSSGSNSNPTTSITSPANGASFTTGSDITISADASDTDGTISKVEFYQGTIKLGEDLTSPYSYTWTNVSAGSYDLTAVATDDLGATGTSSVVSISVTSSALTIGSVYKITASHSSKSMAIKDAKKNNNIEAAQQTYSGASHQQWILEDGGSGVFKLRAVHSSKYLEIKDSKTDSGIEAVQNTSSSSNNQKWDIVDVGGGLYKIVNQNSGLALGVEDAKQDEDAVIRQYSYSGAASMKWNFELVSSGSRVAEGTSLEEQGNKGVVMIYPNPAKDVLNIQLEEPESAELLMMNVSGQLVISRRLTETNTGIDLSGLANGVYFVTINSANENMRFKLIKD